MSVSSPLDGAGVPEWQDSFPPVTDGSMTTGPTAQLTSLLLLPEVVPLTKARRRKPQILKHASGAGGELQT